MMSSMTKYKGIALIQVLILTAILSVIALYISSTSKQHVQIANWIGDKSSAYIKLYSTENELLFSLLTKEWRKQSNGAEGIENKWNFHGAPFELENGVTARVQDLAGLLNIHYPNIDILAKRLEKEGVGQEKSKEIINVLLDWQDTNGKARPYSRESKNYRNAPMSDVSEWRFHSTLPSNVYEKIKDDFTVHGVGYLNLKNSPFSILSSVVHPSVAEQVQLLRDKGMTAQEFSRASGIRQSENVFFTTSSNQKIEIISRHEDAIVSKTIILELLPHSSGKFKPFNLLQTEIN